MKVPSGELRTVTLSKMKQSLGESWQDWAWWGVGARVWVQLVGLVLGCDLGKESGYSWEGLNLGGLGLE